MLRLRSRKTTMQMIQSKPCAGDARSCSMLIDPREAKTNMLGNNDSLDQFQRYQIIPRNKNRALIAAVQQNITISLRLQTLLLVIIA